jgi:hypothetical protein
MLQANQSLPSCQETAQIQKILGVQRLDNYTEE